MVIESHAPAHLHLDSGEVASSQTNQILSIPLTKVSISEQALRTRKNSRVRNACVAC